MSNAAKKPRDESMLGIDAVCDAILDGMPLGQIASRLGRSKSGLLGWIAAKPERSVRVRDARAAAAVFWDEEAERVLREATDGISIMRARELASHFRWRASKTAPTQYGDKLAIEQKFDVADRLEMLRRKGLLPHNTEAE